MKNSERGFVSVIVPILVILLLIIVVVTLPKVKTVPLALPSPSSISNLVPTPVITSVPTMTPPLTPIPTKTALPTPTTPVISGPPGVGYSYVTVHTEKGNFGAQVLSVDLNSSRVITDTANDSDCANNCPVMSVSDFVAKNGGFAGVNGTYQCPGEPAYPDCASKANSFDYPVWNTRLGHWINGSNLGWNSRSIFYTDGSGAHFNKSASGFSGSLNAGIVNYPGLLDNGNVQIDDNQSGLSDKQKAVGTKVGIGLIDQKHVIVVIANSVNMQQFAYVFKALGAKGALNLDTGGSTALYFNGRYMAGPGRNVPNAIIFAH